MDVDRLAGAERVKILTPLAFLVSYVMFCFNLNIHVKYILVMPIGKCQRGKYLLLLY